jgi:hypothetical protein
MLWLLAGCGPTWSPGELREVAVLRDLRPIHTVTDRAELDRVAAAFAAAEPATWPPGPDPWTHHLDVSGGPGGRWLYDARTGTFALLSVRVERVQRVSPETLDELNVILRAR